MTNDPKLWPKSWRVEWAIHNSGITFYTMMDINTQSGFEGKLYFCLTSTTLLNHICTQWARVFHNLVNRLLHPWEKYTLNSITITVFISQSLSLWFSFVSGLVHMNPKYTGKLSSLSITVFSTFCFILLVHSLIYYIVYHKPHIIKRWKFKNKYSPPLPQWAWWK